MGQSTPEVGDVLLSTLTPCLDRLLGGGIPEGCLSLVYGEASTGKTTLSIQCAVSASRMGLKTLYIDSDHSLSHQRLLQVMGQGSIDSCKDIIIFFPRSFMEQSRIVESLENYITYKVGLVIVDTVTSLYRLAINAGKGIFTLNRELNRQLAYLDELTLKHGVAALITGQVRATVNGVSWRIEPVARRTLFHWPRIVLRLKSTVKPNVKEARLERGFSTQNMERCYLELTDSGLRNLFNHE
ncbi:MAG: AAA family ATPase [Candidatus Bathyarchaeia archaeon]